MATSNVFGRIMAASGAAVAAFRAALQSPSMRDGTLLDNHRSRAAFLWSWYTNTVFDALMDAASYRERYNLYRATRTILNPVQRVVDWYAGRVYPGAVTINQADLPNGVSTAIPLGANTDEAVRLALGAWWDAANWQVNKSLMVRYGSLVGDVLVSLVDEPLAGFIGADVVWPGEVAALDLDGGGQVERYRREYAVLDDHGQAYQYAKEVTPDTIRTFKNGQPFAYAEDGLDAWDNPYGFVPAVWIKHKDIGGLVGDTCLGPALPKLDEANQYLSLVVDRSRKVMESPVIITAPSPLSILNRSKTEAVNSALETDKADDRDVIRTLRLPQGTEIHQLDLNVDSALKVIEWLNAEIESDLIELTLYKELRAMQQVTGPGATRLVGDVDARLQEAAANYDRGSETLFTMALAVSGWRAKQGAWGNGSSLNERQRAFLPFDLDTYTKGQPVVDIIPRPLLPETREEQVNAANTESRLNTTAMRRLGYSDEEISQAEQDKQAAVDAQAGQFERMMRGG